MSQRGSAVVELVLVVPLLLALLFFVVAAGRVMQADNDVAGAAGDAARAAAAQRSPAAASAAANAVARSTLADRDRACRAVHVRTGFDARRASASVACDVDLSDLGLLGVPGHRRVEARGTEVLDVFRGS